MRAIRKHIGDFVAVIALFLIAVGTALFILHNERLRIPLVEKKPFVVKAELRNAQAVQPGQGQTVRVAGVEVGRIGKVQLENGRALVNLELQPKYKHLLREDATALLRTKTGLKDMFIEVDPGDGKPLKQNAHIQLRNTLPDINPDEVLSALDADTRDYLKLLITGAGKGLKGRGSDLRETLARLGPLHRDLARVTSAVARRRRNLRHLIHVYGLLVTELGRNGNDLTRVVRASNAVLSALAQENQNISSFVAQLPGSLRVTERTLRKVDVLGQELGPTLEALRPPFRELDRANHATLPFLQEATPIIRRRIRPFVREARPFVRDLGGAGRDLAKAAPDVQKSLHGLNRFFNIGAFNPGGAEGLTGNPAVDAERKGHNEGYLFWLAWTAQNTVSLFSTSDAQGPWRRIFLAGIPCALLVAPLQGQIAAISGQIPTLPPPLNTTFTQLQNTVNGAATALQMAGVCT